MKLHGILLRISVFRIPFESVGELTRHIVDALHAGKSVAVHCRQGIGRSVVIAAAALISDFSSWLPIQLIHGPPSPVGRPTVLGDR